MKAVSLRRILVLVVTVALFTTAHYAQSGRRGKAKPTASTTPSVSDAKQGDVKTQPSSRLYLLVGVHDPTAFDRVPYYVADTVLDACLRRLAEAKEVVPNAAPRRMSRSDAVKAAKAETTRYVVWLQVGNERADSGAEISTHSDELYVTYMILEPGTAKVKQTGRAQHSIYKVGNVGVSGPSSIPRSVYSDYAIKQSAREAADKILAAFEIRLDGWPR